MNNSDVVVGLVQYEDTFQTILAFDKDQVDKYSFSEILTRYCEDDMNVAEEIQGVILRAVDSAELMDMTLNEFILPDELQFDSVEDFKKYFEDLGFKTSQELDEFIANDYTSNQDSQLLFDDASDFEGDDLPFDEWGDSDILEEGLADKFGLDGEIGEGDIVDDEFFDL